MTPTLRDIRTAFLLHHREAEWDRLVAEATHVAYERAIEENLADQRQLIALLGTVTGSLYFETQKRLTGLFEENDRLVAEAFPGAKL